MTTMSDEEFVQLKRDLRENLSGEQKVELSTTLMAQAFGEALQEGLSKLD